MVSPILGCRGREIPLRTVREHRLPARPEAGGVHQAKCVVPIHSGAVEQRAVAASGGLVSGTIEVQFGSTPPHGSPSPFYGHSAIPSRWWSPGGAVAVASEAC